MNVADWPGNSVSADPAETLLVTETVYPDTAGTPDRTYIVPVRAGDAPCTWLTPDPEKGTVFETFHEAGRLETTVI